MIMVMDENGTLDQQSQLNVIFRVCRSRLIRRSCSREFRGSCASGGRISLEGYCLPNQLEQANVTAASKLSCDKSFAESFICLAISTFLWS